MSTLEIYTSFMNKDTAPPVILNIYDSDAGSFMDDDDFLGRAIVDLRDCSLEEGDALPDPRWHKLVMGFDKDAPSMGEILCSFALVEDDFNFRTPLNYMKLEDEIEYKEQEVEINILGLRGLQSFGLMPVKKPFIKFNIRSLLPPEKAKAVTNIKTTPGDKGPNPNINTVISFLMKLPADKIFCPVL
jgi:hypothetical protein